MKEDAKIYEIEIGGKKVTFETGRLCEQSNGSCLVRCGETVVMVNVTMSKEPRPGVDFFPLSVDFEEKNVFSRKNTWRIQKTRRSPFG